MKRAKLLLQASVVAVSLAVMPMTFAATTVVVRDYHAGHCHHGWCGHHRDEHRVRHCDRHHCWWVFFDGRGRHYDRHYHDHYHHHYHHYHR